MSNVLKCGEDDSVLIAIFNTGKTLKVQNCISNISTIPILIDLPVYFKPFGRYWISKIDVVPFWQRYYN